MSISRFIAGFAVGAGLGALAGILLAPQSGEETREALGNVTKDVVHKTEETVRDIQDKADTIVSDMQQKGDEIISKIQDLINKQKEEVME